MVNANLFSVVDVYLHWEIELVFLSSRQLQLDLGNLSWISLGTDVAVRAKCLCPSPRVTTVSWLIPHTMMEDAGGSLAPCGLGKKAAVNWKPSLLRLLWISWQRTSGVNEMESYSPMGGSSYTNCVSLCIIDDPPQCRNPLISALARVMNTLSPGAAVINPSVPIWWAGVLPSFENLILVLPWVLGFQRESGTREQWVTARAEPLLGTQLWEQEAPEMGSTALVVSNRARYWDMYGTMSLRNEAKRGKYSSFQGRKTESATELQGFGMMVIH